MMMPSCRYVCEHASEIIEKEPPPATRIMLRLHLLMCRHCRRYIRQFGLVLGMLPKLEPKQEPSDEEIEALIKKLTV